MAVRPAWKRIPKVAFTFDSSKLLLYWASMPEEGLVMRMEQNGTFWDTRKKVSPAGRGLRQGECHEMSRNVTPKKAIHAAMRHPE